MTGLYIPDDYDDTVEYVEAEAHIIEDTVRDNLEHHFNGKQYGEEQVTQLQNFGECIRLNKIKHDYA
jgi:hypothetical protein